jgi:predicted amidohydrolase YtcJ
MTVPPKRIEQMRVMMTMVGGRVVYRDADFRHIGAE